MQNRISISLNVKKRTIVPAVQEPERKLTDASNAVETHNRLTGESSWREVKPTPSPTQRFVKQALLTLDEVREQLVNAGNSIDSAKEQYQADVASLDAFYAERNALRLEIAELETKLREKQARLNELETAGSPKDRYLAAVVSSEREVAGIAGALFTTLSERASQKIFGIPFDELSPDGKRDVQARFRKIFQRYTSGFYVRLGRTAKTVTVEQVASRADELLNDVSGLIEQIY